MSDGHDFGLDGFDAGLGLKLVFEGIDKGAESGIGLAVGYLNRPDLTARKFIPDFMAIPNNPSKRIYRTGDLGRINEHDEVEFHGRIDTQALTYQQPSLQMRWCLDCHRNPENYLRPRDQITTMGYEPKEPQAELGARLVKEYHVQKLETCWTCHR